MEKVIPGKTRLGWIGTGVMGTSMCGHLLSAGFSVTLFNRTRARAQPLLDRGARWADHPRAVAKDSDVVFSIVGHPADVPRCHPGCRWSAGRLEGGQCAG